MVPPERFELPTYGLQNRCTTVVLQGHVINYQRYSNYYVKVERGRRIELLALAWKAKVLPLYEPRIKTWSTVGESNSSSQDENLMS